jgi:hypothetical protein
MPQMVSVQLLLLCFHEAYIHSDLLKGCGVTAAGSRQPSGVSVATNSLKS